MSRIRIFIVLAILLLSLSVIGLSFAQDVTPEATLQATVAPDTAAQSGAAPAPASGGMLTGLRHLHSLVRWLLVIVTVVVLVKLVLGLAQKADYDKLTQRLMMAFSMLASLQWLIGLVFFIVYASTIGFNLLQPYNWLHVVVMTVAVALANMYNRFKDAPAPARYRSHLILVVMVLVLVIVGVALLPQGWRAFPLT
ncbi:MAG TPA: hypothetical protein VHO69_08615 [Phototrophicaceae bacterium]|nr:hypothetical protein [Phototrophicaceae bacterium]